MGIDISSSSDHCKYYYPLKTRCSASEIIDLLRKRNNLSLGSRAYRISAPTTWNSLPQNVHDSSSLASFQNHLKLKTYYFSSAFSAL